MVRILDRMEADGLLERRARSGRPPRPPPLSHRQGQAAARGDLAPRRADPRRDCSPASRKQEREAFIDVLERLHANICALDSAPIAAPQPRTTAARCPAATSAARAASSNDGRTMARNCRANPTSRAAVRRRPRDGWKQRLRLPLMLLGADGRRRRRAYFYLTGGRYEIDRRCLRAGRACRDQRQRRRPGARARRAATTSRCTRATLLFRLDDAPFRIAVEEAAGPAGHRAAADRVAQGELPAAPGRAARRRSDTLAFQQTRIRPAAAPDRLGHRLAAAGRSRLARARRGARSSSPARSSRSARWSPTWAATRTSRPTSIRPVQQAQAALDRAKLESVLHRDQRAERRHRHRSSSCRSAATSTPRRRCSRWCRPATSGSRPTSRRTSSTHMRRPGGHGQDRQLSRARPSRAR